MCIYSCITLSTTLLITRGPAQCAYIYIYIYIIQFISLYLIIQFIYLLYMTEQFQLLTEQLSLQSQQTMNPESVVSSTSGANCLMLIYLMLGGRVPSTWLTA